jgi:hypothetical protein
MASIDDLMSDYTVKVKVPERRDPRLGRVVVHDSRARMFAAPEADTASLTSIRHKSSIPVLDQGDLGACTGVSATKCMSYGDLWAAGSRVLSATDVETDNRYGIGVYSAATKIDPWPGAWEPDDTGSNGASVAKVLKARGLISGYVHAFSLGAALGVLAKQAVITGIPWTSDMFRPSSSGEIKPTGDEAGGHEIVLDELDVERKRVWICNQWSADWGVDGRAWMSWDAFGTSLSNDGDVTAFIPATQPAPVPTPPAPTTPYEVFRKAGDQWAYVERHSSASNTRMVSAYKAWRDAGSPGAPAQ